MNYDFAIVGAGIAGASLAAELTDGGARVILLEAEDRPGYHATGRSAAFWDECYGGPEISPLTLASGPYLQDHGFLKQRGALYIGRRADARKVDAFLAEFGSTPVTIERLAGEELRRKVPGLREDWIHAIWEPGCADIDVAGLHQHYLSKGRANGAVLRCGAKVTSARRYAGKWTITSERTEAVAASVLVNAAGAWADTIAQIASVHPLGIEPLRRTVVQARTSPAPPLDMPLVLDIAGGFYFKPEAGKLWLSPHDEVPSKPGDVAAEEIAVAEAVDRLQQVVNWQVEAVERKWAGLRSFAPDRLPVYGYDPHVEGFAWFAGQGGYGIQTAPAAARLCAQMLLDNPRDAMTRSLDASIYAPDRFG